MLSLSPIVSVKKRGERASIVARLVGVEKEVIGQADFLHGHKTALF